MNVKRSIAWVVTTFVVAGLVMLVVFAPLISAVMFVACVAFAAVHTARQRGFWSGVKVFIKEILVGWYLRREHELCADSRFSGGR